LYVIEQATSSSIAQCLVYIEEGLNSKWSIRTDLTLETHTYINEMKNCCFSQNTVIRRRRKKTEQEIDFKKKRAEIFF
jgi:hypothetical protein